LTETDEVVGLTDALRESPFMRACRREPVPFTPVWLMRQAGRYMREYREVRERTSFLELCKTPDLAAEVTVTAVERLGVDAAIIFADILLIIEPMGIDLEFARGDGPKIHNPVRQGSDIDRLREVADVSALDYVYEAIRRTRRALPPNVPLIGFCGAPFTLASYIVEGGGSKNYIHTKQLMYNDPGAWHAMMGLISRALAKYLNAQVAAGAQAVQLFDSWVGCLSPDDYREYVLPHTRDVINGVIPGVPVLHFGTGTGALLELMREAGGDVIGIDWRVRLDEAWVRVGHNVALMGNLDPVALYANVDYVRAEAKRILDQAAGRAGHIFNLGHGILPTTPVDNVLALIESVHELSRRDS
jgi:uroporphyrinogen decarboxylase